MAIGRASNNKCIAEKRIARALCRILLVCSGCSRNLRITKGCMYLPAQTIFRRDDRQGAWNWLFTGLIDVKSLSFKNVCQKNTHNFAIIETEYHVAM